MLYKMATLNQENPVNIDVDHLFQKIENLQIALKASADANQLAQEQAKKDRRKYQTEVDRICAVANLKQIQMLEKIKHYEDQFTSQLFPCQVSHQAQQTLPEDFIVIQTPAEDAIDRSPNQKNFSTKTIRNIDTVSTQTDLPEPRTPLVKNIDTVSTQTDQDEVVLSNLIKISKLEGDLSKMDHNQDLLLSELNLQNRENYVLQTEITMMTKKMAKITYANNLYHVSHVEQNCSLPADAEELLSSLSKGGQADDLHPSFIMKPSKEQDASYPFQKIQVDIKQDQSIKQIPESVQIASQFPMKEDSTRLPKKETKTPRTKELAWITQMSKALLKLETKPHSLP